ncbi:MAG: hypothetical protein RR436_04630 [Clostridia bacterium]
MKKTKNSRIIAAIAMLVVSATALTTSSFAWFTMNKEVSATGLSLTATVPTNLEISDSENGTYGATVTLNTATKKFVPISGVGYTTATAPTTTLFYAETNKTDGDIKTTIDTATTTFKAIPGASDNARQYYVDVPVWIRSKASLDTGASIDVAVSKLDIKSDALKDAYRVATIEKPFIYSNGLIARSWTPLATATTLGTETSTVVGGDVVAIIPTAGTAQKVTLRIWLEGQDSLCKDISAGKTVSMDIQFTGTDKVA